MSSFSGTMVGSWKNLQFTPCAKQGKPKAWSISLDPLQEVRMPLMKPRMCIQVSLNDASIEELLLGYFPHSDLTALVRALLHFPAAQKIHASFFCLAGAGSHELAASGSFLSVCSFQHHSHRTGTAEAWVWRPRSAGGRRNPPPSSFLFLVT